MSTDFGKNFAAMVHVAHIQRPLTFPYLFPKITDGQLSTTNENMFIRYILLPHPELKK